MDDKPKQPGRVHLFWSFLKGGRLMLLLAAASTALNVTLNFITPQIMRLTLDSVLGNLPFALPAVLLSWLERLGGREFLREHLILCAAASVLCAVCGNLMNMNTRLCMARCSEGTLKRLRDRLYDHIGRLPYAWHVKNQTGDIIQRCTSDVDVLRNFLSNQVIELFRVTMLISIAVVWMYSMNPKLTTVSLVFIPVVILYSGLFSKGISKRFRAADEAEGELSSAVQENLTGVRVVRAFGREAHELELFEKKNKQFADYWIRFSYLLGFYWGVGDFVTGLQVMLIVALGTVLAVRGELTLGEFTVFVAYNTMMSWPLRAFGRILGDMSKMSVSLGRLNEILLEEIETDDPEALKPPMNQDIAFEQVTFGYEGGPLILKDLSFHAKAGSTVGILGGTGSGKSTLACLLNRLYDLEEGKGRITVGGVDIRDISLSYLRRNIGYVLQEPFLFSKTIGDNIKNACPESDTEAVRTAARIAAVDDTIQSFSQGYDTMIGEKGITLSGGQKQRVAIARMLLQKTSIKIFDDSLSAVDTETDAKIRAALREEAAGATVFIIAHRITSIMHADQILVLEEGRLSQEGTHWELIAREGIYKRIYNLQRQIEEDETSPEGAEPV